ncbi:CD225/dispanin family protein [Arenibacter latericius]|uniref:CD225/dispanin family protein n=1 Tax=Arenibacter latericius TaxID=86104 RepID=UPI0003F61634|nr:CD225/dispanin family protein [Arenibacter latericius]MDX1364667.1 CD225/dispanin family protein [Arenibacter latericius]
MENDYRPKPSNYLILAIFSTVFCCIIPGIVSIIYAAKVNEAYALGNYDAAERASKNAKTWALVSIGLVATIFIICFAVFGFAAIASFLSNSY